MNAVALIAIALSYLGAVIAAYSLGWAARGLAQASKSDDRNNQRNYADENCDR